MGPADADLRTHSAPVAAAAIKQSRLADTIIRRLSPRLSTLSSKVTSPREPSVQTLALPRGHTWDLRVEDYYPPRAASSDASRGGSDQRSGALERTLSACDKGTAQRLVSTGQT